MSEDWPTQKEDLQFASEIVNEHILLNDDEPISLLHLIFKGEDGDFDVQISDFMADLTENFIGQYGFKKGRKIACKVITKLLLAGKTIH
ncbi:MAG: hypothetical protein PVG30_04640 [Gammaproteobacteria bacterium]|jgi:hypothetical protein